MKNGKNKQKKVITKIIQGGYAFKGVGNYTNLLNFARTKCYTTIPADSRHLCDLRPLTLTIKKLFPKVNVYIILFQEPHPP